MIADVLTALVVALFLEMLALGNKWFKRIIVATACVTLIFAYFISGCRINFIGEMDLAIWILFIVVFDEALMFVIKKIEKHIKE